MTTVSVKKNFIFSFFEKVLRAALSFVSLGIVARYLGPEQYGTLSYLLALVSYFQLLGAFGLDHVLMRLFVAAPEKMDQTFWETIIFKSFFSLLSIIFYIIFLLLNGEANTISILFGISILASVFDNNRIFLETKNKHHVVAKIEIFYQIISAVLKIIFSRFDLGINLIFGLFILDFFVTKIIMYALVRHDVFPVNFKITFERYTYYLKAGAFHCLSAILVIMYMKLDQVILGRMMGMSAVGNYSAAVRISDAWYFLPVTISSVFFPMALDKQNEQKNSYLQIIFDLTIWVAIVIIGFSIAFSDEIFKLMFGNSFNINKQLLNLLFYSGFFISLCVSTAAWLNIKGDRKVLFIRSLVGAFLNIILNLYLIPRYELIGCGVATLVSYMVTFSLTFLHLESSECKKYILESLKLMRVIERLNEFLIKKQN